MGEDDSHNVVDLDLPRSYCLLQGPPPGPVHTPTVYRPVEVTVDDVDRGGNQCVPSTRKEGTFHFSTSSLSVVPAGPGEGRTVSAVTDPGRRCIGAGGSTPFTAGPVTPETPGVFFL